MFHLIERSLRKFRKKLAERGGEMDQVRLTSKVKKAG
jgi:hypothetical protein